MIITGTPINWRSTFNTLMFLRNQSDTATYNLLRYMSSAQKKLYAYNNIVLHAAFYSSRFCVFVSFQTPQSLLPEECPLFDRT